MVALSEPDWCFNMTEKHVVDTYLSKQEGLVVEFIRRTLQAETKIAVLESALLESGKKAEVLKEQLERAEETLNQSLVGLKALTVERDELSTKVKSLMLNLNDCLVEKSKLSELTALKAENETIKSNYELVCAELTKLQSNNSPSPKYPEKKAHKKAAKLEWSDGE
jgi:chromosome segregation ATPase